MWQELIQQVGIIWVILVFVVTAGLIAFAVSFFITQRKLSENIENKLIKLARSVNELEGCRIENLEPLTSYVTETMSPEFQEPFARMVEDSHGIYGSVWIPEPRTRLVLPDILPAAVRAVLRKSTGSAILLGGIAATTLALSSAYALHGLILAAALLRLIAVLPLVAGAISMLALFQIGDRRYLQIKKDWHVLMLALERRLPVYSQAAETAVMIGQMKAYDAQMAQSVKLLAEQVQTLASGKLTDAVSGAVKYVMAATIAPAVIKSTEALTALAQEIEKQQKSSDHAVVRLYSELEVRQQKQAELWQKRYQEISEVLAEQQGTFLKSLSTSQQQLVDDLGRSQTFALERVVDEQKQTLQHMNGVAQKSWTILQEKLTLIINQLADGQQKLLTSLTEQQQSTLSKISDASIKAGETSQKQYQTTMDQLQKIQTEIWQKQNDNQKQAFDALIASQKESMAALAEQQHKIHQKTEKVQQEGLLQMQSNQASLIKEIDQRQAEALQTISSQQAEALLEMNKVQNKIMGSMIKTQDDTLTSMSNRIQEALQQLADSFSGDVSGTLARYLEPVTTRLESAAESLIAAQDYAMDVKDVLKMQSDAATTLQTSIGDLFTQLIETRKAMTEDLQSMKTSSSVMSKAAEAMSSVYAGSQSGLSEAISQMSNDLMRLSDVLSSVMSTSAEQTKMIQSQSMETYEVNQKHLDAVRGQINILSDELSTRIEELMIGFTRLTEDLVNNIDKTINTQNDTLGGSMTSLTEIMGSEARSMSLFAQQINMDIDTLNNTLKSAVGEFDTGIRKELSSVLGQFDTEISDVIKRLARVATELGDSVEALPKAIRHAAVTHTTGADPEHDRRG